MGIEREKRPTPSRSEWKNYPAIALLFATSLLAGTGAGVAAFHGLLEQESASRQELQILRLVPTYTPTPKIEIAPSREPEQIPTPTPEIKFLQDFERKITPGEIPKEEHIGLYTRNLVTAYCNTMNCQGFYHKGASRYLPEEMTQVWQEEKIEPIVFYRIGVTNEIAHLVPEIVLGPDQAVTLEFSEDPPFRFRVSRIKGFALYGTFDGEKGEMLTKFNEMVILWASNEFAQYCSLSSAIMIKDKEHFELTQEAFFRLGIGFDDVWPHYRASKALEFASFLGKNLGGMTDRERLSLGCGFLYALDKNDKEAVNYFLKLSHQA